VSLYRVQSLVDNGIADENNVYKNTHQLKTGVPLIGAQLQSNNSLVDLSPKGTGSVPALIYYKSNTAKEIHDVNLFQATTPIDLKNESFRRFPLGAIVQSSKAGVQFGANTELQGSLNAPMMKSPNESYTLASVSVPQYSTVQPFQQCLKVRYTVLAI